MYQPLLLKSILNASHDDKVLSAYQFLEQNKSLIFTTYMPLFNLISTIYKNTSNLPDETFLLNQVSLSKNNDITNLMNQVQSQQPVHINQIQQYAILQKKIGLSERMRDTVSNLSQTLVSGSVETISETLDEHLFNLTVLNRDYYNEMSSIFTNDEEGIQSYIQERKQIIEERKKGEEFQWELGIDGLSDYNIYIRPTSSFIVYGAYVGNGKSTLVRKTIISALKQKKNVYLCSTEMSESEILSYILSDISQQEVGLIPQREIEKLSFTGNNEEKYWKLLEIFGSGKYGKLIVDYPTTSLYSVTDAVQNCIIYHKTQEKIDLFMLDYLTNISPVRGKYSPRDETTLYNNAIRDTKRDLLKHSIPAIMTAQLNRKAQTEFLTKGKFPKNDAIYMYSEFDRSATQIIFVGTNDETDRPQGIFRLQIAKNRNGGFNEEDILLLMNRKTSCFNDYKPLNEEKQDIDEEEINEIFEIFSSDI